MYIKYNDVNYHCKCNISKQSVIYYDLPEDFPSVVEGEIVLCTNGDFVMRTDNTADYLRQTYANGKLTLTNIPKVEISSPSSPVKVEPTADEILNALLGVE